MPTVDRDGAKVHYEVRGNGTATLPEMRYSIRTHVRR
jgi:hypothetical protein